jgi:hypothetical protein
MATHRPTSAKTRTADMADESVGALAELYLGNILYALELAALSLESQGRGDDAGFYRGVARQLAEARGRERKAQGE